MDLDHDACYRAVADRKLIERHVARVIVKPKASEVCLIPMRGVSAQADDPSPQDPAPRGPTIPTITLGPPAFGVPVAVKSTSY